MKPSLLILLTVSFFTCVGYCSTGNGMDSDNMNMLNSDNNNDTMSHKIKIEIGAAIFTATLFDNATAIAFKAMLPITVNMTELNGNEKYFHFSTNLPANASSPSTIRRGDLMLWNPNSLVLFYQTFSTHYAYTKLGRIDDTSGLAEAVGSGNVTVSFVAIQ